MDIGNLLLIIAGLFFAVHLFFLIVKSRVTHWHIINRGLVAGGTLCTWGSLLLLLKYIFDNAFSYKYVLEHSSTTLSLDLKLSVLWAGQEGSFLLWTAFTFLFYLLFVHLFAKQIEEPVVRRSFFVASILCITFAVITLISNPFLLAEEIQQEGWGLNPLLRTLWNIVHPPLVFIGYASASIPFSIVIARMSLRRVFDDTDRIRKVQDFLNLHMSITWTFLTLGIILGGYWAYVTLGWGGYWAWDPVETTSLIVWLFCTAYFHGKGLLKQLGLGVNAMVFLTFFSVIFATFVTRSGIIGSVHGFAESPVTLGFLIFMFGSLITFVTLFGYQISRSSFSFSEMQKNMKNSRLMLAMFCSVICIIGLIVVSAVGVIYPILLSIATGSQYGIDPAFFNRFSFPFAFGLVLSVFFCTFPSVKRGSVLVKLVGVCIGLGLVFLFFGLPTISPLANVLLPITFFGLLCIGGRVIRDFWRISKAGSLLKSSSHTMLHLGLCLILLGVLISANTQAFSEGWHSIGSSLDFGEVYVELNDVNIVGISLYSYEIRGEFLVYENVALMGGGYAGYAVEPGWGSYSKILIVSNFWRDVYINLDNIQIDQFTGAITHAHVEVTVIKLVSLVWAGCLITLISIITMLTIYGNRFVRQWRK